jgi:hypothetical protein
VDGAEIEDAFAVRLADLKDPESTKVHPISINGERRTLRVYRVGDRVIWGATARILENLLARLS